MPAFVSNPLSVSIEFDREMIDVTTMLGEKQPDEKWLHVDLNEHGHFWKNGELPTLRPVVVRVEIDEDGEEHEITEWRCRACDELIEPGYVIDHSPKHIYGQLLVTVTLGEETFQLSEPAYVQSLEAWREALRAGGR